MSDFIPPELLIQILLKLPVKSLIRFTSVCKSWHSLIRSPSFIYSHLSNAENLAILGRYDDQMRIRFSLLKVIENGRCSFSELEIPFKSRTKNYIIIGSCDGLVCLSGIDRTVDHWQHVIIWNPSVRNHVDLPIINREQEHVFVLGFGVANHVYKVVRLVYYSGPNNGCDYVTPLHAEIFSLSSTTMVRWRRVTTFGISLRILKWCQVFLKGVGVVHWLAYGRTRVSIRVSILTFKVGDEVFGEVMLPDELSSVGATSTARLFIIGESLGVLRQNDDEGKIDVWMMKEYGVKESWTKLYSIDLVDRFNGVADFWSGKAPWAVQGRELLGYDPEAIGTKTLGIYGIPSFYVDNYVESVLLLKGYSGAANDSSCPAGGY